MMGGAERQRAEAEERKRQDEREAHRQQLLQQLLDEENERLEVERCVSTLRSPFIRPAQYSAKLNRNVHVMPMLHFIVLVSVGSCPHPLLRNSHQRKESPP